MLAIRVGAEWYVTDDSVHIRPGELLRVCQDCGVVLGIKSGCGNTGISHGLCDSCLKVRMDEMEHK